MKTLFYAVMAAVMLMAVGLALAGGTMMVNTNTGAITYPTNWPTANDIARQTGLNVVSNWGNHATSHYPQITGRWRIYYSDGNSNYIAIPLGTNNTYLRSSSITSAPTWHALEATVTNIGLANLTNRPVLYGIPMGDGTYYREMTPGEAITNLWESSGLSNRFVFIFDWQAETNALHSWLGLLDASQAVTRAIAVAGSNLAATATGSVAVIETTKVSRVGDSMTGWLLMGTNGINVWKLGNAAGKGASGTDIIAMGSWAGDTASGNEWTAIGPYAGSAVSGDDWTAIGPYAGYTAGTAGASDHWAAFGSSAGRAASGMRWGAFGYYAGYAALSTNSYAFGSYAGRSSRGHRELFFDSYDADPNYAAGGSTNDCGYKSSAGKVYWGTGASHTEYPLAGGELRGSWYSALLAPVQSNAYDLGTQLLPYKYGYITYLVGTGFVQKVAGNGTNQVGTAAAGAMQLGVSHGRSTITATGAGSIQSGSVDAGAVATNSAAGALQLHALTAGQRAETTVDGLASLLIGAGTASNKNAVAIGDGMETHGDASLTVAGDIYHGTTNVTARLDLHQAWLGLLTPSQQVDRTIIGTVSNLVDLTTASGQVTRTMATGVISSQQVDRAIIGNVSNALDAAKSNPRYVTSQSASELANEQVLSATDFRVENNRVNVNSRFDANDAMLAFKLAEHLGITALDLSGSLTWIFNNQSGVDLGQSANQTYVASGGGYYQNKLAGGTPYCLSFDNSDDDVTIPYQAAYALSTGVTLSVWHNLNAHDGGNDILLSHTDGASYTLGLGRLNSGGEGYYYYWLNGAQSGQCGTIVPVTNAWVNVILTHDNDISGQTRLYTNGVLCWSNSYSGALGNNGAAWTMGNVSGGGYAMNGMIDEVSLWTRQLTEAQVQTIAAGGAPGVRGDTANAPWSDAVMLFHLDEGTGTDAANEVTGSTSGTLENGPTWESSPVCLNASVITNMALVSTNIFGGTYSPTYARLLVEQQNVAANITNNVDVMYWVSGNNGTNWDQIMLAPLTSFAATNGRVYLDGMTNWTMTALTNQWRWKVTTPGKKETRIYKANMGVGQ